MIAKKLSFGVKTAQQQTTYPSILKVWQAAEANPVFEHAWLFDHFAPIFTDLDGPCLEGWTLLAALAAQTERLRLGLMVTGNTYRHPAVLAKTAATLDVISNGRLDFGIGAGWNEYDHTSMGIPLYPPGERLRRFEEACTVIKSLFTQRLTSFDGHYYQLNEARCEPKPVQQPYPPFVIGGAGEQVTLRIVAKHADIWNSAPVRDAHPIQGAAFLSYFVDPKIPWAHLDIAGVSDFENDRPPYVAGPTGFGVRLLAQLFQKWSG